MEIKLLSDGIYSKNHWKKVHYNKPDISFRKNLFTITAEASKSEDTIFFNDKRQDEMRFHWIDYPHAFSMRHVRFTFPTNENVGYEFKWTFQTLKHPLNEFSSIVFSFKVKKYIYIYIFYMLGAKGFQNKVTK